MAFPAGAGMNRDEAALEQTRYSVAPATTERL